MSAPMPAAAPPPAAPTYAPYRPRRRRLWLGVGGATAAVVGLVVLLLAAVGVLPGLFPSAPPPGPAAYSAARTDALGTAAGERGGPWTVLYAAALNGRAALTVPSLATLAGLPGCGFAFLGSYASANLTLPADSGNPGLGVSPAWLFLLRNASDGGLVVAVLNGVASPVATVGGASCALAFALLAEIPASVIDSTSALATADDAGGTAFLGDHPEANVTFGISGGVSLFGLTTGARWSVQYTACAPTAAPGSSAPGFNVTVNATYGTVVATGSANVTCTGVPALPLASPAAGAGGPAPILARPTDG